MENQGYEITALSRGLRVLALMMEQPEWHTLGQLSRSTGLSRNAVFRILKTFEKCGVAVQRKKTWLLSEDFEGRARRMLNNLLARYEHYKEDNEDG